MPGFDRFPSRSDSLRRASGAAWAVGLLLLGGCAERPARVTVGTPEPDPQFEPPPDAAAPFALTDQTGAAFSSEKLAGKVWLGSIFFANCAGPCYRENQAIAELLAAIDHPDFVAVSLTCDPENDTPDALRRYADRFKADPARWKFLTGDMDVIRRVGQGTLQLTTEVGVHAEAGVVFDRQGKRRGRFSLTHADRVELLEKLIREVLAEPVEPPPSAAAGGEATP